MSILTQFVISYAHIFPTVTSEESKKLLKTLVNINGKLYLNMKDTYFQNGFSAILYSPTSRKLITLQTLHCRSFFFLVNICYIRKHFKQGLILEMK
jgi:hypothetical protein